MLGLIEFPTSLRLAPDAIGATLEASIGEAVCSILLPTLSSGASDKADPIRYVLDGPGPASQWEKDGKLLNWGIYYLTAEPEAHVSFALLNVPCSDLDAHRCAQDIYRDFPKWVEVFEGYLTLLTKQNTRNSLISSLSPSRLELFQRTENVLRPMPDDHGLNIEIDWLTEDDRIYLEDLREACSLTNSGTDPRLEYRILLRAYEAQNKNDYRMAVIEAASALEVALTSCALTECRNQGIAFGKALIEKYRMLGGRFELVEMLGVALPSPRKEYQSLVIQPRNDALHKAGSPTRQTARQMIETVESLLKVLSPQLSEEQPTSEEVV